MKDIRRIVVATHTIETFAIYIVFSKCCLSYMSSFTNSPVGVFFLFLGSLPLTVTLSVSLLTYVLLLTVFLFLYDWKLLLNAVVCFYSFLCLYVVAAAVLSLQQFVAKK